MSSKNHFSYAGVISFMPQLRTTSNGGSFLPITLKQESSSVSIALFDLLAVTVANGAATGQELHVEGWLTSRKNSKTGYFETSLNGQRLSLDGGKTWHTSEPRPAQQPVAQQQPVQQAQGFQQPLQQMQTPQQQMPQVQPQSGQPVQQQQQQVMQTQPVQPVQQQNNSPYNNQPTQQAVQAQQALYGQQQPQQTPQVAPVQQQQAPAGDWDDPIPF